MASNPHRVSVPESQLEDLRQRLSLVKFPDELDDAGWDYGSPLADVKRLVLYWHNQYDWRAAESRLNELPNFTAAVPIDGFGELDLHFLHQKSTPDAIPLLFVHGWVNHSIQPGSYLEVTKMLSSLAQSANGVKFHVVAPSLPNFAWSSGVKKKGFGLAQYAEACHRLMLHLGYNKYVTQGGGESRPNLISDQQVINMKEDWGMYITRTIGLIYPESCLASHINMVRANPPDWTSTPLLALQHAVTPYTEAEQKGRSRSDWFANEGSGYRLIQSTKPQTVGYALNDSPVALLAWILEKLHDWTDKYPWTDDEILTWVSVYWFSKAGPAASLRIYYEAIHTTAETTRDRTQQWIGGVKLGLCYSPKELTIVPRTWGRTLGPVVFESEKSAGGHFLAWERPEEVVADLRAMFGSAGPCYNITKS